MPSVNRCAHRAVARNLLRIGAQKSASRFPRSRFSNNRPTERDNYVTYFVFLLSLGR